MPGNVRELDRDRTGLNDLPQEEIQISHLPPAVLS